jgi:hypothetical protein
VYDTGDLVRIKLVPRLEFNLDVIDTEDDSSSLKRKKGLTRRPPQKLFNHGDIP